MLTTASRAEPPKIVDDVACAESTCCDSGVYL